MWHSESKVYLVLVTLVDSRTLPTFASVERIAELAGRGYRTTREAARSLLVRRSSVSTGPEWWVFETHAI
jgi:hypothetical protein